MSNRCPAIRRQLKNLQPATRQQAVEAVVEAVQASPATRRLAVEVVEAGLKK
jgi:hypothetical protein